MNRPMVPSDKYDKKYFLTECGDWAYWLTYKGKKLSPRLQISFELANVEPSMNVLDFGCGRGEVLLHSAMKGANVVGIDYSEDAIDLSKQTLECAAKQMKGNVTLICSETKRLAFEDNYFDVVFMLDIVEHLYDWEIQEILREMHRVLKRGGRVIIHTPNKNCFEIGYRYITYPLLRIISTAYNLIHFVSRSEKRLRQPDANPRNKYQTEMHVNEQTEVSLKKHFENAGFRLKLWLDDPRSSKYQPRNQPLGVSLFEKVSRPYWVPPLRKIMCQWIWGIAMKEVLGDLKPS